MARSLELNYDQHITHRYQGNSLRSQLLNEARYEKRRRYNMKRLFLAAALLAMPTIAAAQAAPTPATYVMKAGAGDQYEIQSSRLVLATTKNAELKQFATMMVADHTKSTADVKAAAMRSNLTPKPPMLDAM